MRLPRSRSSDILKLCTGDQVRAAYRPSDFGESGGGSVAFRSSLVVVLAGACRRYCDHQMLSSEVLSLYGVVDEGLEASLIRRVEGKLDR